MAEQQVRSGDNVDHDLDDETAFAIEALQQLPSNAHNDRCRKFLELKADLKAMRTKVWEVDLADFGYICPGGQDMRPVVERALNTERAFWVHRETGNKLECAEHLRELCDAKRETISVRRELCEAQRTANAATREALTARRQLGIALKSLKDTKEQLDCVTWTLRRKADETSMLFNQLVECRQDLERLRAQYMLATEFSNSEGDE